MGLFSFFNKNNGKSNETSGFSTPPEASDPEIPEKVFIEKENQSDSKTNERIESKTAVKGIHLLFQFLERNLEGKGYDDALMNPDASHLDQNIKALKNELERTIRTVNTFYEDFIREINFHISSRSRSGMIDIVEELTMKKETAESHIKKVNKIEEDAKNDQGDSQGIILSYTRGFKNGLMAISNISILKEKF